MATIIERETESNNSSNIILALVLLFIALLFFFYGLPLIRGAINRPAVQVPSQIDVNINGGQDTPQDQ